MAIYYSFCGSNSGCETSGYHAKVVIDVVQMDENIAL
jgi:hypothetical protein